ncbi:hypothetical protein SsS58_07203 [Streptomyces scabiei]|uniref:Uncharacterized protein n=1 Tax=Streptomyces scabiei TaxID=1930 RepID=A0A100JW36_STRSC|nr:hypothetical protein SsS58_07203 [Streptomyces scabiei]
MTLTPTHNYGKRLTGTGTGLTYTWDAASNRSARSFS